MACSEVTAFLLLLGHIIFRIFSNQCHNSLVFVARQIANNLQRIAKKLKLHFLAFRIIPLERMSNNLARTLQFFLCLFCSRFELLKTGLSNRN